jgi:hypothetical protein
MLGGLKGLFGRGQPAAGLASPLGARIGQPLYVDPLALQLLGPDSRLELPDTTLVVAARGRVDLGDGGLLFRYYTEDHTMVTVVTNGGEGPEHVSEITLYRPLDSLYPGEHDAAAWQAWRRRLGEPAFRLDDGATYERAWFDETPGVVEPVEFTEEIFDAETAEPARFVRQSVMLFRRRLASGRLEFLTAAIEQTATGRSVELMVGTDLDTASLTTT